MSVMTDPADPDKVYAMYGIRPVPALRPPYDLIVVGRGARRVPRTTLFRPSAGWAALLGIRGPIRAGSNRSGYWGL